MDVTVIHNVSLKPYNSFRLESEASIMAFPHNEAGLCELMDRYRGFKHIVVLGKGSNVILSKDYYSDEYLFVNLKLMDHIEMVNSRRIFAQGGASLSNLVWYAIENNIKGLEFLEDIPGTIGGAIIMNAGTYRSTIGNFVKSIRYYDLEKGELINRDVRDSDFSKRHSFWSENSSIILSAVVEAEQGDYVESLKIVMQDKEKRFAKQPRNFPNAGSVFVRPEVDLKDRVVWELLDEVGLRGYSKNGCAFSAKHPGFIINTGGATYKDIMELVAVAKERVLNRFGVELEMEWKVI